jgi:hypothetical protein
VVDSASNVPAVPNDECSEDESSAGDRLYQNVQAWASCIFQRHADAATSDCSFVLIVSSNNFLLSVVFLHELFRTLQVSQLHISLSGAPYTSAVRVGDPNLNA